ncbi:family 43 glycosylhydrolase [Phytohabitans rumicis]|uniref:BIG2 domain-containing protein n=1 Tax=Phytohabitans rumicis TaxID=1076125 RepID=A0A6V8L3G8_9ACTN|nr:family 43 glycosylhydrolase [Phytohabitans rumicis]GFJ89341.1 hypothetical protein Prum_029830 [Phytohabitans rumicis]
MTTANYIGRSVYSGDRLFKGRIRDFRMYDRALTGGEVGQLAVPATTQGVAQDTAALSLGDTSAVTANLSLPTTGAYGSAISWATSDSSVVTAAGVVTRPGFGQPDAHVTLTATLKRGAVTDTKTFDVTVLAEYDDQRVADAAAAALAVRNIDDVRGNLTLPATGQNGTTVAWASANPAVVSATGEVNRPAHGAGGTTVELTATVTKNAASATRTFTATVPELPAQEGLTGYMFSYFTGEGTANGEQVYFGLSKGNDPLHWRELNGGNPVLTSTLGEKGLRDPFIIRSPEGDKFYQIATDLRIYGNGNWDAAQRTGSKSIMVWESTDLVHWTDQRLVQVSPDTAGNTWAPEAYYDKGLGAYVVFWASKLYAEDDPSHTGNTYNKMLYATTRDFHTFSEPKVWVDPGYSVIDSTMVEHNGTYYRFTKDERNNTSSTPCSKFITEEKATSILDLSYDFVADCIGKGSINQGEGPTIFKSNTEEKWYLFIDEFGGRGYVPFESTDLESGVWTMSTNYALPSRPRHGTVLPVTQAEYDRLLAAYAVPVTGVSVTPAELTLAREVNRQLSATVTPSNATVPDVTWSSSDESVATVSEVGMVHTLAPGTATITARTADGGKTASTVVTVTDQYPTDLLLRYEFDETSGTTARDSSGRGNDGIYERSPGFGTGVTGGSVKLSGGASGSSTAPYVTIPNGVLAGADSVTVSAYVKWTASTTINQWIYGLGPDSTKYLFTGPRNGGGVLYSALTTGSWWSEHNLPTGAALPGGSWQHIAVTVDSSSQTAVMYLNGAQVARATNVTVKPSDLYDATKSYTGYIGRSLYSADPYFAGEVDDFRIYNRALPHSEILALAGNTTGIAVAAVPELKVDAIVDDANSKVVLPVKEGTDVRKLAPGFVLAQGATISPASGTTRDLTTPVTYVVTGADGAKRTWTVEAKVMKSPVLPGLYADPNIVVFGNRFYIYPTTDGFAGWSGTQFKAFSSTDLVHWEDHGVILDLGPDVSWADDSAWAPSIVEKNGKYYFYFSGGMSTGDTRKHLGVAVADSPTGPFHDALGKPLVPAGTYSGQMIDSAVFTDDDGRSYLYWGNGNSYQVPLNDDMVSFDPAQVRTYKPTNYNEGTFVFKRNGLYYFTWSENDTRSEDYQVAYATGTSPLGPWSERKGVFLAKDLSLGIKGTGHHSVVNVPGTDDWYIAYHRFAIPGGDGTHRETTIDKLEFEADGTIKKVVPTLESVEPVVNHAPVAGSVAGPLTPVAIGADATVSVPFTDVNPTDLHSCAVDWKDGTVSAGTIAGGQCTATHRYAGQGVFEPVVTVADLRGGSATATLSYLVTYNAAGSYVAGSGTIDSLGGRGVFGVTAGTAQRNGAIALRFRTGDVDFSATTYQRLALGNREATYTGVGTLAGRGEYAYTVSLEDGRTTDRFWIRITNKRTGAVVYDSRYRCGTELIATGAILIKTGR